MKKLYPIKFAETEDLRIVRMVEYLIEEKKTLEEDSDEMVQHKFRVKALSHFIRKTMGDTGMISLALSSVTAKVLVCVYDKEATEDNFMLTHYDDDRGLPYILADEEERLNVPVG